ncbi:hypothetical protein HU200_031760 [Digitaria exilis]|uniref:DUF642 domain-containing protein n=1 Tax=Digitaria exilis TaxID=1010633 RepID=A0A835BQU7_9POAL|nr:hypothetical protein HU200_031760 [Digitaria exilis]
MATRARSVALFVLLGVAARAVSAVTDGMLPNGHFEQGPDKSQLNGTRVMGRYSIPHWEISGIVEYIGSGQKQDDMILPVPEGEQAVRLGNDATICQQLSVVRHTYYSITFGAARTCAHAERLNVSVTPESGVLPIQTVYTSSGWDAYSWAFKAKHTTVWLCIHNPGHEDHPACGPLIDAVAIKTIRPPHQVKSKICSFLDACLNVKSKIFCLLRTPVNFRLDFAFVVAYIYMLVDRHHAYLCQLGSRK